MARISKQISRHSKMAQALESINMQRSEREIAQAHMESAELFADLILRAGSSLQSMVEASGHGCNVLVHRVRAVFGKLAHH